MKIGVISDTHVPTRAPCVPESIVDHFVPADKKLDPEWAKALFARGPRRVYRGEQLETIGMPCGGICAGQLYVRGDGTLAQWWIANNAHNTGAWWTPKHSPPGGLELRRFFEIIRPAESEVSRPLNRLRLKTDPDVSAW